LFDEIIEEYNPNAEKSQEKPKEQQQTVEAPKTIYRQIPKELQRLFAYLQHAQVNAMSTKDLTVKGFNWKSNDTSIQHDVHELIRVLFDSIERSLVGTKSENLINKLYRGNLAHQIKCLGCGTLRTRNEYAKFSDRLFDAVRVSDVRVLISDTFSI
jgi:predicted HNH restriction endonuclease